MKEIARTTAATTIALAALILAGCSRPSATEEEPAALPKAPDEAQVRSDSIATEPAARAEPEPTESAASAPRRLLLWKATRDEATVYLFGSIHAAEPSMYPLDPAVEEAFRSASALVVELDVTRVDHEKMTRLIQNRGTLPQGETLSGQLTEETVRALTKFLEARGMDPAAFASMRPWVANLMLNVQEMQRLGFRDDLGVDKHFLDQAAIHGQRIVALETVESQFDALSAGSKEQQDLALRTTIEEFADSREMMNRLVSYWKSGDAEKLEALITDPVRRHPQLDSWFDGLFGKRNAAMAAKIARGAKATETHFVVVGAGHLVGDQGLPKLLETKGFKVERVRPAASRAPAE